jgi:hypothetical protein
MVTHPIQQHFFFFYVSETSLSIFFHHITYFHFIYTDLNKSLSFSLFTALFKIMRNLQISRCAMCHLTDLDIKTQLHLCIYCYL